MVTPPKACKKRGSRVNQHLLQKGAYAYKKKQVAVAKLPMITTTRWALLTHQAMETDAVHDAAQDRREDHTQNQEHRLLSSLHLD